MLLITGASGFVGQHLLHLYHSQPESGVAPPDGGILPVWRSRAVKGGAQLDLADLEGSLKLFRNNKIKVVIHLAAEARTGVCQSDPSLARKGNEEATANLLYACRTSAKEIGQPLPYFMFISTDMVWRGDNAPYDEAFPTDAISAYGASKAAAEKLVQAYEGPWSIVRPALVYGAQAGSKVSVLNATLQALQSGEGAFFTDEIRTPVFVGDLIRLIAMLADSRATGIYNAGGPDRVSRYDLARLVADTAGFKGEVKAGTIGDDPRHAWRPRDISMVSEKAHSALPFTPLAEGLRLSLRA